MAHSPECPGTVTNGICNICSYADDAATERARKEPKIVVPKSEKQQPRGAAHRIKPEDKNPDGTHTVWRRRKDKE
jgi:hypothetical protein